MKKEDNALAVVKKAIAYYKINVTDDTIAESLQSHPQYPSLKSICDVLNEWKIDNYPMRLDKEELREMGVPFIAHLNDQGEKIAFVPKLNGNSTVEYFDSSGESQSISKDDFFEKHTGVSLLIDPDEQAGEEGYVEKKQTNLMHKGLPYVAGLAFVLIILYQLVFSINTLNFTYPYLLLLITKLTGLILCLLMLLKDLNIKSDLADSLCGVNKKTDCNSLLNTEAARAFGWLHWSDVGFIYFLSGLLVTIGTSSATDYGVLACLSFASIGYVLYSVYYQAVVAKTWCQLCLSVQVVFLAEATLSYFYAWPIQISWPVVLELTITILTTSFSLAVFKAYFKNKQTLKQERLSYLKFKKNPDMFTNLLLAGEHKSILIPKEALSLGKSDASVEITAFLSLNCNPCQKAFNQLKTLFEKQDVKTNLIISLHDKDKQFVNWVFQLSEKNKNEEVISLLDNWYNSDAQGRLNLAKQAEANKVKDQFESLQQVNQKLFKSSEVSGTPTVFLNGYRFPREYEIQDILYFASDLKLT